MEKSVSTDSLKMQRNKLLQLDQLNNVLLSSAYLAPVDYYIALFNADKVSVEQCEYYTKQSYRNRCKIASANGVMDLIIPVNKSGKELIKDIRISEHGDWQTQHWRSIESAYNSSPFFEYYIDDIKPFFEKKWLFLWDFNMAIQEKMLELLDVDKISEPTASFQLDFSDKGLDLRELIHPKKAPVFEQKSYYQVFEQKFGFLANLSIVDLLFNMGNESQLVLKMV